MRFRLYSLFAFIVTASLLISGCALSHRGLGFYLRTDRQLYSQLTDPITITLSSTIVVPNQYHSVQYEVIDNGVGIGSGVISRDTQQITVLMPFPHAFGTHSISARVRPYNSAADYGDWVASTPAMVCVFVGADPPDTYSCSVFGFPQHLEISTETPSILTIVTETPPVTPLIIIRPDNNNNNGNNPGGAVGCAAYGDKSSCDLAGCSWTGSSCTVSP